MSTKEDIGRFYNRVADQFDQVGPPSFGIFGRRLVELAQPRPGMRILDIACGRGACLIPSGQALSGTGLAIGADLSFNMLAQTKSDLLTQAPSGVTFTQVDAEQLAFASSSFDLVLCAFGIFFLDANLALKEWQRVLKPYGQVAVSIREQGDPRWNWYEEKLRAVYAHLGLPVPTFARRGARALLKPQDIYTALSEHGFTGIRIITSPFELVYPDAQTWWEAKWTHGSRRALESMPSKILEQFKSEVLEQAGKTGLVETSQVSFILAQR
jgi:O-methyltransferase / aklanonic acid methyltransferase